MHKLLTNSISDHSSEPRPGWVKFTKAKFIKLVKLVKPIKLAKSAKQAKPVVPVEPAKLANCVKLANYIKLAICFLLIFTICFAQQITPPLATARQLAVRLAERLESDSYIIQFGNFNTGAGKRTGDDYALSYTLGQTGAGPYGTFGSGVYFVGGGFQYIYQIGQFTFTISDVDLDLGILTPGVHNTATNTLSITTRGAGGYSVYTYELHPLLHNNGTDYIDDTQCDAGGCDHTEAKPWTDQDIAGFGFNAQDSSCDGQGPSCTITQDNTIVNLDFTSYDDDCSTDTECFRQFADYSADEPMQQIMGSDAISTHDKATITYKVGIEGAQEAGTYQTGIVYIAVPGY